MTERYITFFLKCDQFYGKGSRYFAIPASSMYIKVSEGRSINLAISEDDLQLAKGLKLKDCPLPNLGMHPSIYEIFHYMEDDEEN
jgi:hypothetical protein